eukprot:CAMPEP_0174699598 /NCGR_PEP_ID=MMETSP1094-20130205/4830_1 /TAXON_ID=156173 /ORGANISM="Chrysochromulina brevifilum, Strain UTEX LB 985" /LENGTH=784 /DNA_ID=CAMNT_0015896965 /DNA_START=84 /DNA_END=2440 /DNA_ORIENTATION=+
MASSRSVREDPAANDTAQMREELTAAGVELPSEEALKRLSQSFHAWLERARREQGKGTTTSIVTLFKELDDDGSGFITFDELAKVVRHKLHVKAELPDSTLKSLWCILDQDDSNQVQIDEFSFFLREGMVIKPKRHLCASRTHAPAPAASSTDNCQTGLAERRGTPRLACDASASAASDYAPPSASKRTPNQWVKRLGSVVKGQSAFLTTLMRVRMARRTKLPGRADSVLEVETEAAMTAIPIWQQGDAQLYTAEALQARASCRQHADVVSVLHVWWQTAQRSLQSGGDSHASTLGEDRYVHMLVKIYKTMIEAYDEAEARECAADDWERDRQGHETINRIHFCDALFELADMWTATCQPDEYVRFLWKLLKHIAVRVDGTAYLWKEDCAITFDSAYADWDGSVMLPSPSPTPGSARHLSRAARRADPTLASPVPKTGGWAQNRWPAPQGSSQPPQLDSDMALTSPPLAAPSASLERLREKLARNKILNAARAAIRRRRAQRGVPSPSQQPPPRSAPPQLDHRPEALASAPDRPHTSGVHDRLSKTQGLQVPLGEPHRFTHAAGWGRDSPSMQVRDISLHEASGSSPASLQPRNQAATKPGTAQLSPRPTVFTSRLSASRASTSNSRSGWRLGRSPAAPGVLTGNPHAIHGRPTVARSRINTPTPSAWGAPPSSCTHVDLGQQLGLPGMGVMRLQELKGFCGSPLTSTPPLGRTMHKNNNSGMGASTYPPRAPASSSTSFSLIRNSSVNFIGGTRARVPGRLPPIRAAQYCEAGPRVAGTLDRL